MPTPQRSSAGAPPSTPDASRTPEDSAARASLNLEQIAEELDRPIAPDIVAVREMIDDGSLLAAAGLADA